MKKLIGYARVSRDRERDKLSPEIQREQMQTYCDRKGFTLVDVIEDLDVKGSSFDRPGWKELVKRLPEVDGVIFISLDRFGRNLEESLRWSRIIMGQDKEIISVHENVEMETLGGRIHYKTLLFVNDLYLEIHSQKMKDVQDHKLQNGEWRGGPLPLGYDYDDDYNVIVNEPEAQTVARIFSMRKEGQGYSTIARALNDDGIIGKRGGRISASSVKVILANPNYIGKRWHGEELVDVDTPPVIDYNLWEEAHRVSSNSSLPSTRRLLSSLLFCERCGSPMHRQKIYTHDDANYVCSKVHTGECKGVYIRESVAERELESIFSENVNGIWKSWDAQEKRKAVEMFVEKISIKEKVKGKERIDIQWRKR